MRVSAVLESMPGVGKVRAQRIMEKIGISASRRVRGLGTHQRAALAARVRARSERPTCRGISRRRTASPYCPAQQASGRARWSPTCGATSPGSGTRSA